MADLIRMDEYCSSVRDGTHDTPKPTDSGYYLVTSKAINNNSIDLSSCYFISKKDYNKINERSKVDKWDVIMTMIGTVGRLHLVQDEPEYAIKNIALFKVGDEDRAKWLYYYLSTSTVQNHFELIASGTSQHFIGLGHLRSFKIENYRNNSKQITNILSAYDNLIEINNKRIKVLEQMAENLYKEWFIRFRFPGHETAEFENGIPKGWEILKIADVANIKAGGDRPVVFSDVPTEECPIPIFSNGLEADGLYGYTDKAIIKNESVTISARGTVGFVCFRRKPYVPIVRLVAVIPKAQTVTPLYLYYYLQRDSVIANGTSQQQITVPMVSRKHMIIPPTSLLQAFDKREYPIWSLTDKLKAQNENLIKQRNLLLPRLMSGKLEVV